MIKSNTKPKGATSYQDTAFGIISRSKLLKLELEGTKRGLEYLYDLVSKEKKPLITPEKIIKLHEVSFGWIFPDWAGKYRTIQVVFSGKEAVEHYQVPELVSNLCQDLNERLFYLPKIDEDAYVAKVVSLLAWFQHRFVLIHPFKDYNGRTARMLTSLILFYLDLPPIELKAETESDRKQYLKAMQKADSGDYSFLENLIGKALIESLNKIQKKKK
ncbi:MAG: hypothetical protein COX79_03940 [Candidatus Levybacteria bacterium CG_4_10_14_0_2_um_filter_36_16]|nr:MAG: hypothetical protein COU26_04310 [Candidatus Levybacteria bacterium CG10_big_fil_rev_8_21_14_0_10_36_30]PIZ96996.1 MAG: hypothetical protein COX79_03940 [Candidatus Levybacteria bacterium CG_4_10_14_0_2_um_filter_36_16]